jgi:60S ribosome subunit biogenesis protein NIP7
LDLIAAHARYKIYIKSNGVMPFLYGSNVLRAHLSKYSYVALRLDAEHVN